MNSQARRYTAIGFAGALVELTDGPLAAPIAGTIDDPQWAWIGPAFVARMNEIIAGIQHLVDPGLETEAASLTRSLYDHAVVFAWLASDPSTRLRQWLRVDGEQQLRTKRQLNDLGASGYLPSNIEALFESLSLDTSLDRGFPRDVAGMAVAADRDWHLSGELSFTTLYTVVFRQFSTLLHPSLLGLSQHAHRVTTDGSDEKLLLGYSNIENEATSITTQVPMLYAAALTVAARSLGWPDETALVDVVDKYPRALALLEPTEETA